MKLRARTTVSIIAGSALLVVSAVSIANSDRYSPIPPESARSRHDAKVEAIRAMHAGDHGAARTYFRSMIQSRFHALDAVEGHRMLALSHRLANEVGDAAAQLNAAADEYAAVQGLQTDYPWVGIAITMDRAELAAFHQDDVPGAIALYDSIPSAPPVNAIRDARLARQNAAVLSATLHDYPQACRRLDDFLASPLAANLPTDEVIGLRTSQVFWYVEQGNLEEAVRRGLLLWNDFPGVTDPSLVQVAVTVASWYPAPSHCDERADLLLDVFARIDAIRRNPRNPGDESRASMLEREAVRVAVDSADCDNQALAAEADRRR